MNSTGPSSAQLCQLITSVGAILCAYVLYKIFSHPAGGWNLDSVEGVLFTAALGGIVLSPYFICLRLIRTFNFHPLSVLVITVLSLRVLYLGYEEYGHGTPIFLSLAISVHCVLLVLACRSRHEA
jgi:hypothetical protein